MSSSDEDDYMSDAFLAKSISEVRPGLIKNRGKQREIEIEAKKARYDADIREANKPTKQLEQERRTEGLSMALGADNKGFAMLTKMGYKSGHAIGKGKSGGIVEPIGIEIKTDRGGLGRDEALRQLKERRNEIRAKRLNRSGELATVSTDEFRRRITQKAEEKQIEMNLGKCQRACEKLDEEEQIITPAMVWFWPQRKTKEEQNEDEDDDSDEDSNDEIEYEPIEKLEMLTAYLRTTYCYCHWCGTHYSDITDMNTNCPGQNKDDH